MISSTNLEKRAIQIIMMDHGWKKTMYTHDYLVHAFESALYIGISFGKIMVYIIIHPCLDFYLMSPSYHKHSNKTHFKHCKLSHVLVYICIQISWIQHYQLWQVLLSLDRFLDGTNYLEPSILTFLVPSDITWPKMLIDARKPRHCPFS